MLYRISHITYIRQRRFVAVCGHRPKYFFDFPRNSLGRFICMGDNDLTTKRPNRAQLGRFRFSRNSTQAIALHDLRAFRALFRGVIRI